MNNSIQFSPKQVSFSGADLTTAQKVVKTIVRDIPPAVAGGVTHLTTGSVQDGFIAAGLIKALTSTLGFGKQLYNHEWKKPFGFMSYTNPYRTLLDGTLAKAANKCDQFIKKWF
ncbi:MAG: hypothetical protein A2Y25_04680 [Candidatus Melainabacteria bacterium GWF2_37_15]|nr:MAG: hypothetical protein A2Y25_04680 [Candidatus Melainabacteria bacterium GWF2_37_15]